MRIATGLKRQASVPSARRRFPAKMGLMSGGTAKPLCGALRHSQPFIRDDDVTGLDAGIVSPLRQPCAGFSFASKIRFPRHGEITLKLTFWFRTSSRDVPSASQRIYDLGRRWSPPVAAISFALLDNGLRHRSLVGVKIRPGKVGYAHLLCLLSTSSANRYLISRGNF